MLFEWVPLTEINNRAVGNVDLLIVLGFNSTFTAKVISWRSVTHVCFLVLSQQYKHNFLSRSHRLLFSHASAEVRGENTLERKFASISYRTHNHQVMSQTRSPLSHRGRRVVEQDQTARMCRLIFSTFSAKMCLF